MPTSGWQWPPFRPAFPVRLTMLLVYVGCAVLVGLFARWWALIPLVLLA
ncbi:MAG: hypothetical protein QOG10_2806, partial [Kribbellaceae bacterium]|nr:hypothetical protein [Kribbellaceae bacterium]